MHLPKSRQELLAWNGDGGCIASYNKSKNIHMSVIMCYILYLLYWLYYTVHILYHTNHKCVSYGYHCIITSQNITNRKCLNGDDFSPCDCTWVVSAISLETTFGVKLSELWRCCALNYEDVVHKDLCTGMRFCEKCNEEDAAGCGVCRLVRLETPKRPQLPRVHLPKLPGERWKDVKSTF